MLCLIIQISLSSQPLIMWVLNNTSAQPLTFLLTGIPGLRAAQIWVSIPVCLLYAGALSGNSMILFVVLREQSLHEPMYYFLSMLSATDLSLSLCTLSTTLGVFWFEAQEINLNACVAQMFFLHGFTFMESGVLLAMAFDHFVAICDARRYTTILTNARIAQIGMSMLTRKCCCDVASCACCQEAVLLQFYGPLTFLLLPC